jgi:hypothetical protein
MQVVLQLGHVARREKMCSNEETGLCLVAVRTRRGDLAVNEMMRI